MPVVLLLLFCFCCFVFGFLSLLLLLLLFCSRDSKAKQTKRNKKHFLTKLQTCAYAGTGNVLMVQELLHAIVEPSKKEEAAEVLRDEADEEEAAAAAASGDGAPAGAGAGAAAGGQRQRRPISQLVGKDTLEDDLQGDPPHDDIQRIVGPNGGADGGRATCREDGGGRAVAAARAEAEVGRKPFGR